MPYISILNPKTTIVLSIDINIMRYIRGVYIVKNSSQRVIHAQLSRILTLHLIITSNIQESFNIITNLLYFPSANWASSQFFSAVTGLPDLTTVEAYVEAYDRNNDMWMIDVVYSFPT